MTDLDKVDLLTTANLLKGGLMPVEGPAVGYAPADVGRVVARASEKAVRAPRSPR